LPLKYELIYEGSPTELQSKLPALEEQHIPEGGMAELVLNFKYRWPGFENAAVIVNDNLLNNVGVTPWPGEYQIVYVDTTEPIWYVRWQKGAAWAAYVVAALAAIAIILLVLSSWKLLRVVPEVIERYPWLVPVAIVGGLLLFFLYWPRERAP